MRLLLWSDLMMEGMVSYGCGKLRNMLFIYLVSFLGNFLFWMLCIFIVIIFEMLLWMKLFFVVFVCCLWKLNVCMWFVGVMVWVKECVRELLLVFDFNIIFLGWSFRNDIMKFMFVIYRICVWCGNVSV